MKNSLKNVLFILLALILGACSKDKPEWVYQKKIDLPKESRPLAMVKTDESLWISDPENYQVLRVGLNGKIQDSLTNIKRPMNIDASNGWLYVPEYLTDTIWRYKNGIKQPIRINTQLQAPAGITVDGDTIAVADFYNHRVVIQTDGQVTSIGKEGHGDGELYYPTDAKIFEGRVYVADA